MSSTPAEVVVAGHTCLDIIPTFAVRKSGGEALLLPGRLVKVGPVITALGGAVSNTGLTLHRLGIPTRLMGKIGNDFFGRAILDILRGYAPALAEGMLVTEGEHSSYSLVISPPGMDRTFLHYPGTNDTFSARDIVYEQMGNVRLFHFGYPPLMYHLYADGGNEFAMLLRSIKEQGVTTSLDMALPDPESEAGRVDWTAWLERVLPYVDLFLPSVEEILYMVDRDQDIRTQPIDGALLSRLSERLLQSGVAVVALKLGEQGLYVRTAGDNLRLTRMGSCTPQDLQAWTNRELLTSCFRVNVVGTTGAGDCTIGGFLAGLLQGLSLEEVLTGAVAAGACSVEYADATSGVPTWSALQARIQAGWERCPVTIALPGWHYDAKKSVWVGPHEATERKEED